MITELREYIATDGAEEQLHQRFQNVVLPLFDRHDMTVDGFWVDEGDRARIVYLLRFDDRAHLDSAWASFQADSDWREAKAASEANGPIVASMSSRILHTPSYFRTAQTGAVS